MRIKYSLQTKPTQNISASTTYLYVLLTEPNALIVWISAEEYEYSAFKVDTQVNLQGSLPPYNCSYLLYKNKYWVGRPIYDIPEAYIDQSTFTLAHPYDCNISNSYTIRTGFEFPMLSNLTSKLHLEHTKQINSPKDYKKYFGISKTDLNKWCLDTQVRLVNEFIGYMEYYKLNRFMYNLSWFKNRKWKWTGKALKKYPSKSKVTTYTYDQSNSTLLNLIVSNPAPHYTRGSYLELHYDFSYLHYLIWSYENKEGRQLTYPNQLSYWEWGRNPENFKWVKVNRDYGEIEDEVASEEGLNRLLYQNNYLNRATSNNGYFLPPLPTIKPKTTREEKSFLLRQHIFILTKILSIKVNVNKSKTLPYIEFIDTKHLYLESFELPDKIKVYKYIKWNHKSFKTEIGIFIENGTKIKHFNTEGLIYLFNKALLSDTVMAADCQHYVFRPNLSLKLRQPKTHLEVYLDLNPGQIPQITLILNNFLNLRIVTGKGKQQNQPYLFEHAFRLYDVK